MTADTQKQRGYRIRATIFVPCDPRDLDATAKAITYAQGLKVTGEFAPEGTVVEDFSCLPGRRTIGQIYEIERVEPENKNDAGPIPAVLQR